MSGDLVSLRMLVVAATPSQQALWPSAATNCIKIICHKITAVLLREEVGLPLDQERLNQVGRKGQWN